MENANTTPKQTSLVNRLTRDLAPHSKVKHLAGRWLPGSDAAKALRRSIQERGIVQPLVVTEAGEIMDGVTRWQAAKALQLETVPCIVQPEEEALELCIETELHRRHGSKSQLAFRFAPLIEEAFEDNKARMLSGVKQSSVDPWHSLPRVSKRVEEYAAELGVSPRLLRGSHELHTLFDTYKETWPWSAEGLAKINHEPSVELNFRDYFTAHILAEEDPMSLGGALAGLKQKLSQAGYAAAGRAHGGGKPTAPARQLRLFCETFKELENRYGYWTDFDDKQREAAVKKVSVALSKSPTDFLEELAAKIKTELAARKAEGK